MKIDLNKKQNAMLLIGSAVLVVFLVMVVIYRPLMEKHQSYTDQLNEAERNLVVAKDFVIKQSKKTETKRLINHDQIALAINEIMEAGEAFAIYFIAIDPKEVEKLEAAPYGRLPIEINIISEYKNAGLFLNRLKNLNTSVITVQSFNISRDESTLPLVNAKFILEVYLKDG